MRLQPLRLQAIRFKGYEKSITGDELMQLSDEDLAKSVIETQYSVECIQKQN